MEIVAAVASKVGEYLVEATIHQVRYVFPFNCIVEKLKGEVKILIMAQDSLQQDVDRAKRNTEEFEKDVQEWLTKVSNVVADVQKLEEEILENKACLKGWSPNWGWRYQLSRKAAKKRGVILKLLDNRDKLNKVSHLKPLPGIEFSAPRDFMSFKATKLASDQIIEELQNEKTKMVGLYGIGGVGKTTLAKVVGNNVQEHKIFDEVVMVAVSQNPNFIHIQDQLADSLSLKLEEKSEEGRAKRLNLRFTETNSKILIILDDVWEQLDLKAKLGIPVDDGHSSYKILLTTRQKQVYTAMGCQVVIRLNILEVEEGLALLKRSAGMRDGSTFISNHEVIHDVAKECNGLPLALVTIGKTLRGKGVDEWKIVSQKLKRSKLEDVPNVGGEKGVYACLQWSFDNLKNEKIRICFLLCSLFPEDYEIPLEELVRYGVGKGLFQDVDTIEDARKELLLIVG